jgi:hypothetical protein
MTKEGNSYTNLLKLIKQHGYNKDVYVMIGIVKTTSPLTIDLGDFVIEDDDFYKCSALEISVPAVEDKVLVLRDDNDFFVIDKVV